MCVEIKFKVRTNQGVYMNRRLGLFLVAILIILSAAFEVKAEQEKIKVKGVAPPASEGAPLEIRRQEMFVVAFFNGIRKITEMVAEIKKTLILTYA